MLGYTIKSELQYYVNKLHNANISLQCKNLQNAEVLSLEFFGRSYFLMEHLFVSGFGFFAITAFFLFKNQYKSKHATQFLKKDIES